MDQNRFVTVVKLIRMKQFVFTDSIMQNKITVTCSACKQHGHNRKNKSCPHVYLFFIKKLHIVFITVNSVEIYVMLCYVMLCCTQATLQ